MKVHKVVGALLVAGLALTGLSACEKKEGPAEKAGKALDQAASDISDNAKKAGEAIDKTASDISDSAKETMEEVEKKAKE
jgi:flagellar hook-basal body complex protein FliE